jgi:carbamoyl-phosphate synthase large subunit
MGKVDMNLLITSISNKVSLIEAIRFQANLIDDQIKIYGADSNSSAVAKNFVDGFFLLQEYKYLHIETFIQLLLEYNIAYIIPSSDLDLNYLSSNILEIKNKNINVMISPQKTIEICFDKYLFYDSLRDELPLIPSYLTIKSIENKDVSFVLKERKGSGSKRLFIDVNYEEILDLSMGIHEPIIQEYIMGKEYTIDCYFDFNNNLHFIFPRSRDVIVNGESYITTYVNSPKFVDLVKLVSKKIRFCGHVNIQFIVDNMNNIYLLEINPRIGGASMLAFKNDYHSVKWFILESRSKPLPSSKFREPTYKRMFKYTKEYFE